MPDDRHASEKNRDSERCRRYPLATRAMYAVDVLDRLPEKQKHSRYRSNWPAYYELFDQRYSHFEEGPTTRPSPQPREIDLWPVWLEPARILWGKRRIEDKAIFLLYARGMSLTGIAEVMDAKYDFRISRQGIGDKLDSILREIEAEAGRLPHVLSAPMP
jgi:hypothetical protein